MLDATKMVDAVLDAVDKPLRSFHERIKAVETRTPEKGEPGLIGPPGEKGEPGEPGKNGTDGAPADATALPDDLVEQLKSAAQALAEPMPGPAAELELVKVDPAADYVFAPPRSVTGAVITRSGELAISYSDGGGERLGHVIGPQGEKGAQGERGNDGIGIKGDDGPAGRDGISVMAASINRDGELQLTLSDGSVLTPGRVVAPDKKRA